ncbi:MAG: hypothetical protein NC111_06645 [Bacteroides sp.]|nr:hypothetical protein [Bacteroides sp.]MCM1413798.1 hypothetical protein [Bacteroides sp.]MCM1472183.1 hypothetical protein [Bacteroides sp.]
MTQIKKISLLFTIAILSIVSLTSCGDDEYVWWSPLRGSWELVAINGMPVQEADVTFFTFYNDGNGEYVQYNKTAYPPEWFTYAFTWDVDETIYGDQVLDIYIYPGQHWQYYVRVWSSELVLTDPVTGQQLTYMRY